MERHIRESDFIRNPIGSGSVNKRLQELYAVAAIATQSKDPASPKTGRREYLEAGIHLYHLYHKYLAMFGPGLLLCWNDFDANVVNLLRSTSIPGSKCPQGADLQWKSFTPLSYIT